MRRKFTNHGKQKDYGSWVEKINPLKKQSLDLSNCISSDYVESNSIAYEEDKNILVIDGNNAYNMNRKDLIKFFQNTSEDLALKEVMIYLNQKEYPQAMELLSKLQNKKEALNILGMIYHDGLGVVADCDKAFEYWQKAVSLGSVEAKGYLGGLLFTGEGVTQNVELANKYLREAASELNPSPYSLLMYSRLLRVKERFPESNYYLKKAADAEFSKAAYLYSVYLYLGSDIKKDIPLSLVYLKKAAVEDEPQALYTLGIRYFTGIEGHIIKDWKKSMECWTKASDAGLAIAKFALAFEYINNKDGHQNIKLGLKLLQESSDLGYAEAQERLGTLYHEGQHITLDNSMACKLWEKAVGGGNKRAAFNLAIAYTLGKGVPEDKRKALFFAEISSEDKAMGGLSKLLVEDLKQGEEHTQSSL